MRGRGLCERPEQWEWSSFLQYATGCEGRVEIESEWTARKRQRVEGKLWASVGLPHSSQRGLERAARRKGANHLAPLSTPTGLHSGQLFPTHLKRVAALVPQPVTIRLPLASKISRATVSVNESPSSPIWMARVSLCVWIQAPAGLKMKASDAAL